MKIKLEETLFSLRQSALKKINALEYTQANTDLLVLLEELLCEESLLSHPNMPSLLNLLNKPELPALISYIVDLDRIDASPSSPKGSFFAQKTINRQHDSCINLLRNVTSVRDDDSQLWHDANGLLQNALLMYPALPNPSQTKVDGCILF